MIVTIVLLASLTTGCIGGLGNSSTTPITISGIIVDQTKTLDYIDVYLNDTFQTVRFNDKNEGTFTFEVPAGNYQLWAWKGAEWGKDGVAIAKQVYANKDMTEELEVNTEHLHQLRIYTHNDPDVKQINISNLDEKPSVSYGPSVDALQKQHVQTIVHNDGDESYSINLQNVVIGKHSFIKLDFAGKRQTMCVPVFFMELPEVTAEINKEKVTLEWLKVEEATEYKVAKFNPHDDFDIPGAIQDTEFEIELERLLAGKNDIWVQAFKWKNGQFLAESMTSIKVFVEAD